MKDQAFKDIKNASNIIKVKIFFGVAPTILRSAISFFLLLRLEYSIAIIPKIALTITILDIDNIIFSVIDTICHSLVSTIPGIIACKDSS